MTNQENEKKPRKKRQKKDQKKEKLQKAVETLADIIVCLAVSLKCDMDEGKSGDIKHLKELCGAAKELSALMGTIDGEEGEKEGGGLIAVSFEGDDGEWAK